MLLLLDYDGTLTPIVDKPSEAKISPERKKLITHLSLKHTLALVTGRDINSLIEVFGNIPDSVYAVVSHGMDIYRGGKPVHRHESLGIPDLRPLLSGIKGLKGVELERKDSGFALHYRNCPECEEVVRRAFYEFLKSNPPAKVIEGKKVLEALYGHFDKGIGVKKLIELTDWRDFKNMLYVGDDTTDLDAMRVIKSLGGRTAFVGEEKPPEADILLRSVEEVYEFLSTLK